MNLIIDIGNTQTKYAVIKNSEYIHTQSSKQEQTHIVSDILNIHSNITNTIISSVKEKPNKLISYIEEKNIKCIFFDKDTPIPIENLYETKHSLGYDRLAACIGANDIFPNSNILVIDAGTAITYDFVNNQNQYCGGAISLGLEMRYKALNHYTSKLPLLKKQDDFTFIGKTSKDSIISGIQNGIIFELDGFINELRKKHIDLKIILTGGDAFFFDKKLKNCIFVDQKIVLRGLNKIALFNFQ